MVLAATGLDVGLVAAIAVCLVLIGVQLVRIARDNRNRSNR